MFRADLHTHTHCSDGSLSPTELINLAISANLQGLSITDHDTVAAYAEAIPIAKEKGIALGLGAEFSCVFKEMSVHVLGYDFPHDHPDILAFCASHKNRRQERCRVMLSKLKTHKILLSEEDVFPAQGNVGRLHIARAMVAKGYVPTIKQAFLLYLGDHKPCFHLGESVSVEETLHLLHAIGGKAFLAHPHLLRNQRKTKALLELGFDGIECYYARQIFGEEKRWVDIARQKNWLISGGSDFHGEIKNGVPIGASWVNLETFHTIFSKTKMPPEILSEGT